DGLADVHHLATAQIPAIALRAQPITRIASEWRANLDLVDAAGFDLLHRLFVQQHAGREDDLAAFRIDHVVCGYAAQYSIAQRLDDFTTLDQRFHRHTLRRAAIVFNDHQILGYVDQTPCQIAGVRRLQSGISQTLSRAVSR